jgi:ketosteroid isomerase-like protein
VGANADLVAGVFSAFARRDGDAMIAVAHPEIEFHAATGELAGADGPYVGHEGLRRYLADAEKIWGEVRPEPREFHEIGDDRVLAIGRIYAAGSGQVIDAPVAWVWHVRDGLLDYGRVHQSTRAALDELGLADVPA